MHIHTIDISDCYKIRKYKNLHFIFSWTRSLIKTLASLQWPNIIFQPQVAAACNHQVALCECTLTVTFIFLLALIPTHSHNHMFTFLLIRRALKLHIVIFSASIWGRFHRSSRLHWNKWGYVQSLHSNFFSMCFCREWTTHLRKIAVMCVNVEMLRVGPTGSGRASRYNS